MRLTRKELAWRVGLSTASIRRNEKRLGLDKSKVQINARVLWYDGERARRILARRGVQFENES